MMGAPDALRACTRIGLQAAIVVLLSCFALVSDLPGTQAQSPAAVVNGDPIIEADVPDMAKLIELSTKRVPSREEVLDDLIDIRLKLQAARREGLVPSDADVDQALDNMVTRIRMTGSQFEEFLARNGIKIETLKTRIKAELAWRRLLKFRGDKAGLILAQLRRGVERR